MIAICVPSRGLIYSRTVKGVIDGIYALKNVGIETSYHTSHDLPIPDSHNLCIEEALSNPLVDRVVIVEEDNFIPTDAFVALATAENDITTLQYNDKNGYPFGIIHYNEQQEVIWCGLGATAIKRKVFETLGQPYFRIDTRYKIVKKHLEDGKLITDYEEIEPRQIYNEQTMKFEEKKDDYKYGGLDIDFYTRARNNGFKITVLPQYKSHHFKLVKLGEPYMNHGIHDIQQV